MNESMKVVFPADNECIHKTGYVHELIHKHNTSHHKTLQGEIYTIEYHYEYCMTNFDVSDMIRCTH